MRTVPCCCGSGIFGGIGPGFGNLFKYVLLARSGGEFYIKKLVEDSGKKMISKIAHERDEDSKDVKAGTIIKYRNRPIVTVVSAAVAWHTPT